MKENFNLASVLEHVTNGKIAVGNIKNMIEKYISPIGFSAKIEGVDSKLSVFRVVQVSPDCVVQENQVAGSQWFGVNFLEGCQVKHNKFMAMQLTEFSLVNSDLCDSQFILSRMSHVSLQEACFVKNKFTLSTWSDASMTESDFTENNLSRSDFSGTVLNASRLSKLGLVNAHFKDCEFDACDIQGIEFNNCEFKDCTFSQIQAVANSSIKISDCRIVGKQIANCKTAKEFVEMLKNN